MMGENFWKKELNVTLAHHATCKLIGCSGISFGIWIRVKNFSPLAYLLTSSTR
jgi:hypothetical protein